ncbi:MAG: 30S ribosomal protein S19e [Candidatus Micrarchaeota archaeon]|nr:30S ribosomal protein S19e [Candidatus Micrarchaeota archaeon]
MANVFEVDTAELIKRTAEKLKTAGIKKPPYIQLVKTGSGRERPPADPDFWYVRCASVIRQVYINGPVGISKLRLKYGSKKGHVVTRHHNYRAGGSIIKDAFTALEKLGYVKSTKQGRVITSTGKSFLDKIANEISKGA